VHTQKWESTTKGVETSVKKRHENVKKEKIEREKMKLHKQRCYVTIHTRCE